MHLLVHVAVIAFLTACSSALVDGGADAAVLRAVLADVHFVEWVGCDSTEYAIDPISAPPAYQQDKPFFYSRLEGFAAEPDSLTRELLESLQERNMGHAPLREALGHDARLTVSTSAARVWLSLPGYDSGGNAAVSVTRNTAGDCPGAGYVVILRRAGTQWVPGERPVEGRLGWGRQIPRSRSG